MKIQDLVRVTSSQFDWLPGQQHCRAKRPRGPAERGRTGIIIDSMEMDDGFLEYEVMLDNGEIGWYSDLMLEVIDDCIELTMEGPNDIL